MNTDQLIYNTALSDNMPPMMANFITAQSKHETANYSSHAFLQDNNCFGYKYYKGSKWQMDQGILSSEGDRYAKYARIEDSVHELTSWIRRRQRNKQFPMDLTTVSTREQYASWLKKCGYYGDSENNYLAGLTHFYIDMS